MKIPLSEDQFIPTTFAREIAPNIVFRQIRSWHSNNYAGEKKEHLDGSEDRSGCSRKINGMDMCYIPYIVCHRYYWNTKTGKHISTFLSYPDAMGISDGEYFWETLGTDKKGDIERFFGKKAELQMEKKIIKVLSNL